MNNSLHQNTSSKKGYRSYHLRNAERIISCKNLILLGAFLFTTFISNAAHDYHIGIIDVKYNPSNQSMEIAVKLFVHDFETALTKKNIPNQRFGASNEEKSADKYIIEYFEKNLRINLDSIQKDLQFIGKEIEDEHLWTYWEINKVSSFDAVSIKTELLFEIFDDQSFIVYLDKLGHKKSMLLNGVQPEEEVNYK